MLACPGHKRKLIPAVDLVRFCGDAPSGVDRTAESDANCADVANLKRLGNKKGLEGFLDQRANSRRSLAGINLSSFEGNDRAIPRAQADLKFCSPNFDPDIKWSHCKISPCPRQKAVAVAQPPARLGTEFYQKPEARPTAVTMQTREFPRIEVTRGSE